MNEPQVVIESVQSFDKTVEAAIAHYSLWDGELRAIEKVMDAYDSFKKHVLIAPWCYSICPELFELGVNSIRCANIGDFRILYEVNEIDEKVIVTLLLFLSTKQSIEKQLIDHCIWQ